MLFLCSFSLFGSCVKGMEQVQINNQKDEISLISLPPEIHDQIFRALFYGNLVTSEGIIEALKQAVGLLVVSKYFDQFKQSLANEVKERASRDIIQQAFEIAIEKKYPRIATILFLTGSLGKTEVDNSFLEDFVTRTVYDPNPNTPKQFGRLLSMIKRLKKQGYDINPLIGYNRDAPLNLLSSDITSMFSQSLVQNMLYFATGDKEMLNAFLRTKPTPLNVFLIEWKNAPTFIRDQNKYLMFNFVTKILDLAKIDNSLMKYLLDTPDDYGNVPLMKVITDAWTFDSRFNEINIEIIRLLLENGKKVNSKQLIIKNNDDENVLKIIINKEKELDPSIIDLVHRVMQKN